MLLLRLLLLFLLLFFMFSLSFLFIMMFLFIVLAPHTLASTSASTTVHAVDAFMTIIDTAAAAAIAIHVASMRKILSFSVSIYRSTYLYIAR